MVSRGQCHLHSSSIPRAIKANLSDRNLGQRLVVLSSLAQLNGDWVSRFQERLQPKTPTLISFHSANLATSVSLIDITPQGVGIFLRKKLVEIGALPISTPVELSFILPPHHRWKALKGIIVYCEPAWGLLLRVGIRLRPSPKQRRALNTYIAYRKEEILGEVNQEYCRSLEPRRVEDLYF